jgi:hypothetical protein
LDQARAWRKGGKRDSAARSHYEYGWPPADQGAELAETKMQMSLNLNRYSEYHAVRTIFLPDRMRCRNLAAIRAK